MKLLFIITAGVYSLAIVYTIHKYEAAIKQYKDSIEDYKRALNIAKNHSSVSDHTAYLQLNNYKLKNQIQSLQSEAIYKAKHMESLSKDNEALQIQIKALKAQIAGDDSKIQYESSVHKNNQWEAYIDYNQEDIDFDQ